jgi:Leucine-rich repeat (LRR) protein
MKFLNKPFFILFLCAATKVKAQTTNISCNFADINGFYSCQLSGVKISDNENQNIVIGGEHVFERNNALVNRVEIIDSNIPFVMTQLFTTFPNIIVLQIMNAGLTRLQPRAFWEAANLRFMGIRNNHIQRINANAFEGAWNLQTIDIVLCQVKSIDEAAFNGLPGITTLSLSENEIEELPSNVFSLLPILSSLFLTSNKLQTLDGRLLMNNLAMRFIDLENNRINAIQRNFFDNLNQINFFNILRNQCASNFWLVNGGTVTIDSIREGLSVCFNNFGETPEPELRRFILEVRGSFSLKFENGTEIVVV